MSKQFQYREEAIPLIAFDPSSQKYEINDEAIEFIKQIPGPIGVVGVAGMYRTGKSYLLNQMLLNRSDGFGVGPTVNPCTKGIWIWGKPLLGQNQDGENIHILIIDSEGIGALDEDSTHDTRIFALTVLLSSCFIYNSIGSIDESAIQNLSLIVNLTKNIQIKSSQGNGQQLDGQEDDEDEEIDYEDYQSVFPAFIWVVRDFSLQLVDNEGEPVSQKEYLEKALELQKGFTESIEQKNRIRRCLTTFFRERDCHTLVRPLTNEENLQNLDKLSFDKLRPEFFEQVITMRKKILTRLKEKKMNGKSLNGQMFSGLIHSYLSAINDGAVPNIENAWTYICQNECHKASNDALESYHQYIKEILYNKLPMPSEDVKQYHKMAKEQALDYFNQKSTGDQPLIEKFRKELQEKIKQKYYLIKQENEKESQRVCENFIQVEFQAIERKIKMNEYGQNLEDFQNDLLLFKDYFMENGPKTANKEIFILNFITKVINEASSYFLKQVQNQSDLNQTLLEEQKKKLEIDITDLKDLQKKQNQTLQSQISQIQKEKSDLEIKEQIMLENISDLKLETQKLDQELKDSQQQQHLDHEKQVNELKLHQNLVEEKNKDLERQILLQNSEFEKERALLDQKVLYFQKTQEEMTYKDTMQSQDLKNQKKCMQEQIKEASSKYESQIKTLNSIINELSDKIQDFESEISQKDQDFDIQKRKLEITLENQAIAIQEKDQYIQQVNAELQNLKEIQDKQEQFLSQNQANQQIELKFKDLQSLYQEKEEELSNLKQKSEKDKALQQQKIEFLELANKENLQQLEENKKAHEAIIKAFETSNQVDKNLDGANLEEIKDQHNLEIRQLNSQYEQTKQRMSEQIEVLTEKLNEFEIKQRLEDVDQKQQVSDLQEEIEQLQGQLKQQQEQLYVSEQQSQSNLQENLQNYIQKLKQLEQENEDLKQQNHQELKDLQQKSEQSLQQLKNIYEIERETLESRIQEEREKSQKKLQQANEEYFDSKRMEQQNYEEEIENLKEDLREQESNYHTIVSQYDHELALKQQSIETLEKYIKETKEQLQNQQNSNNNTLEQHLSNFSQERKQMQEKLEELTSQLQRKEKENISMTQKKEYLENTLQKKENYIDSLKNNYEQEKQALTSKVDNIKQQLQEVNDQFLDYKIDSSKEIALSNQKNEFYGKKNEDLQKQLENQIQRYEEKLKSLKMEQQQDLKQKVEQYQEERQLLEQKYEKAKQTLKEIEGTCNKQLSQLEKEKAMISEKFQNLEQKKEEIEQKYLQENQYLQKQNQEYKENQMFERKQFKSDLEKYKNQSFQFEQDKNDILMSYERDKALWEGKHQFLEQQKEQARQDLGDALKKFEQTLQHLKKARSNEKDDQDNTLNQLLISMEKKYQSQIQDINETNQRIQSDLEDKNKRLQKELKQFKEQQYIEKFGGIGKQGPQQLLNEKKLSEFIENERKLQQDIEILKQEKEKLKQEYQIQLEQEKDVLKGKIQDLESKCRELEHKRQQMMFEFEKEKAKWNLDRDHLIVKNNELIDNNERLEKKRELMLRENEKLRNDNKVSRRSINLLGQGGGAGLSSNMILKTKKSPNMMENKSLKDITNNNNSNMNNYNNPNTNQFSGIMQYDPNSKLHQNSNNSNSNLNSFGNYSNNINNNNQ